MPSRWVRSLFSFAILPSILGFESPACAQDPSCPRLTRAVQGGITAIPPQQAATSRCMSSDL